jgi:hypothetical protein
MCTLSTEGSSGASGGRRLKRSMSRPSQSMCGS